MPALRPCLRVPFINGALRYGALVQLAGACEALSRHGDLAPDALHLKPRPRWSSVRTPRW